MELANFSKDTLKKDSTFDFSQARFKHLNWKFRIRAFLDGKETLPAQQATEHQHCELGHWFYKEGKFKYGHLVSMQNFEVEHEKMHEFVRLIIELKSENRLNEAEKLYKELLKTSDVVIHLLDQAEADIKALQ